MLLETHGLASEALESVLADIDVVSMDWKLSSDVRRASDPRRGAVEPFHAEHEKFLTIARQAPELILHHLDSLGLRGQSGKASPAVNCAVNCDRTS